MASSGTLYKKIAELSVDSLDDAYPGAIVVAEQFGWLRIALLLNVTQGGIQMTSRGKILNDGGWFYSEDELKPKNIYIMPIDLELADLKAIWPKEEWQQNIEEQWNTFFSKPEHKTIRSKYQALSKNDEPNPVTNIREKESS